MTDRLTWPQRIAVVAALIAIAAFFFGLALAASDSGKAGDDIRWELKQDGSLVIYGSGSINKSVPWSYYYNDITSIEVGEGIGPPPHVGPCRRL